MCQTVLRTRCLCSLLFHVSCSSFATFACCKLCPLDHVVRYCSLSCASLLISLALVLVLQGLTSPPCTMFIVSNSHCSSFLLSLSFYHSHSRPSDVLPQPVSLKGFSLLKGVFSSYRCHGITNIQFVIQLKSQPNYVKLCEISYFHYLKTPLTLKSA